MAKITTQNIMRFYKRNALARFGIPQATVIDNGIQFTDQALYELVAKLGTTQHFTSVDNPQSNDQAKFANIVILKGLTQRLDETKKKWVKELHNVLWAY